MYKFKNKMLQTHTAIDKVALIAELSTFSSISMFLFILICQNTVRGLHTIIRMYFSCMLVENSLNGKSAELLWNMHLICFFLHAYIWFNSINLCWFTRSKKECFINWYLLKLLMDHVQNLTECVDVEYEILQFKRWLNYS